MAPNRNPAVATLADRAQSPPVDSAFWLDAWREELIFFRCDEDEVLTYVSPSVRTILGYRPQELLGRPTREVFSVDHPLCASWHAAAAEAPASLAGQEQRCVARRHDGQNALFLLRERPLVDESGRPAGREAMAQDVTRRIEAELRLRQSERKYRRLVEQFRGDYIIYTRNLRGMLTYVSPSIETMLGVAPDQIVGRTWREVLGNVRRTQAAESWVRDGDDPAHPVRQVVIALTRADGAARMFEIQEWSLYDISGSALAVEGIAKDITDAHQAKIAARQLKEDLERQVALRTEEFRRINEDLLRINEELRASEARYRSVVDTQSEFIVRWRADGTRTFVNESYCRFLGAEARELLGGRIASVIHPDDLHRVADFLQSVSPQNPYSTGEARLLAAQGEVRWTQWTTQAYFDEAGRPVEFQSVGRDVTELKQAADLLRQKEADLAHVSRLTTMGEMVAGIAHELSQPLHAAKTFAEAARRHLDSGREDGIANAIDCCRGISAAIGRTVEIICRLRDFTKARPVRIERVDLNDVVRTSVELLSYEIRAVGAALSFHLTPEPLVVTGDRVQLEQVLVNLLKNACEAMQATDVHERRLVLTTARNGDHAEISVQDSGSGLQNADASRIFDAFYSTKPGGMGMGLSLCKSIAEAHRMHISFHQNHALPGLTFCVALPVASGPAS